jgi:hypothetical protein
MSAQSDAIDRLTASVTAEETVLDSLLAAFSGLADIIRATPATTAAISALADKVDADAQKMAAAVTANTTP